MSNKLFVISGRECVKALQKVDFYIHHQQGSHIIMKKDEFIGRVVVPNHKELKPGTLRAIIKQAGLTVDEFKALL